MKSQKMWCVYNRFDICLYWTLSYTKKDSIHCYRVADDFKEEWKQLTARGFTVKKVKVTIEPFLK